MASQSLAHSSDVFVNALEPPIYQSMGGQVFVGRFVSADEWWTLQAKLGRVMRPEATRAEERALMRELTEKTFPRPWWKFWQRSVWSHVRRLPYNAQLEAVHSFTKAQALANDATTWAQARSEATRGTDSPS